MVVGIPIVGKSTFINTYAKKACAKTGNKPGVTKGKQWIKLSKTLELLDTPGILWPKFEDKAVGLRLAFAGSINDEILNLTELTMELIKFLEESYPDTLAERYSIDYDKKDGKTLETGEITDILYKVAEKRNCVVKGGEYDIDKAAKIILEDFRKGKLGRITLELPE